VVPSRLALILRAGETVGYNPNLNVWHRLEPDVAEALRWLRAGRDRAALAPHLVRRFGCEDAADRAEAIVRWAVLRQLLHLDAEPSPSGATAEEHAHLLTVYWICTQACNLRCTYCYQDATVARAHELSTAEGMDLVDQAAEAGATSFIFTGGEPFSRRDLLELARHSKARGMQTNVITNGHFVTPSRAVDVATTFDRITVSLDHGIPEHHDRFRGDGSWKRAARAIDLLLDAGATVDVNSVVSQAGLADVGELLKFVRRRQVAEHRIVPQYPMGRGAGTRGEELSPGELLDLEDELHRTGETVAEPGDGDHGRFPATASKGVRRSHCGAGFSEVSVDPEGWVYPCKLLQYPANRTSNVRKRRLADIFATDPLLAHIQRPFVGTLQPCSTCIIRNHCGGGCRGIHASFTGDWATAEPLFCAHLRRNFEVEAFAGTGTLPARKPGRFVETAGGRSISLAEGGETVFIPLAEVRRR
jgi:radical SAM protein with 4Fe4S-binding SPASM domain